MSQTHRIDPIVTPLADEHGLHIDDPIEAAQFRLLTPERVSPERVGTDAFTFPVDTAVRFETTEIEIPKLIMLHLRDADGEFLSAYDPSQNSEVVESGHRLIQIATAPMVMYLDVPNGMVVNRRANAVVISMDEPTEIQLGIRSVHESPAATITVSDDPEDLMTAVSYFGSALKTMSCERSFGTLRGHPPAIELGDCLNVPAVLEAPDSPVTIEIPAEYEYVFPIAPLAYYLGATVEPGDEPVLRTPGIEFSLDGEDGYQATVHGLLQHIFFMDCVTRTEGFYQVDLHERRRLEERLEEPIDFATLYDSSIEEQLDAYLAIPFEDIEDITPTWHLTTDVEPVVEHAESLAYITSEISLIRCPDTETSPPNPIDDEPLSEQSTEEMSTAVEDFLRSAEEGSSTSLPTLTDDIFRPPYTPTIEHEWLGPGIPLRANKATPRTYEKRMKRPPAESRNITVNIVLNDPEMEAEGIVEELYGIRDLIQFNVSIQYNLTSVQLEEVLGTSADFFHYIGHVDEQGFRCQDGYFDANELDRVGCRAFLLNACTSYEQGQALLDAGSYGGVATLSIIGNENATKIGRSIARLLNAGFSLRSALSVAHSYNVGGTRYVVMGDGSLQLVQSESGVPPVFKLRNSGRRGSEFEFDYYAYPTPTYGMGTFITPNIGDSQTNYLTFGNAMTFHVSTEELAELLALEAVPVAYKGQLNWSDELDLEELGAHRGITNVRGDLTGLADDEHQQE